MEGHLRYPPVQEVRLPAAVLAAQAADKQVVQAADKQVVQAADKLAAVQVVPPVAMLVADTPM